MLILRILLFLCTILFQRGFKKRANRLKHVFWLGRARLEGFLFTTKLFRNKIVPDSIGDPLGVLGGSFWISWEGSHGLGGQDILFQKKM